MAMTQIKKTENGKTIDIDTEQLRRSQEKQKDSQLQIRINSSVKEAFKSLAKSENKKTLSEFIIDCVFEHIEFMIDLNQVEINQQKEVKKEKGDICLACGFPKSKCACSREYDFFIVPKKEVKKK